MLRLPSTRFISFFFSKLTFRVFFFLVRTKEIQSEMTLRLNLTSHGERTNPGLSFISKPVLPESFFLFLSALKKRSEEDDWPVLLLFQSFLIRSFVSCLHSYAQKTFRLLGEKFVLELVVGKLRRKKKLFWGFEGK